MDDEDRALAYYEKIHADAQRDFDRLLTAISSGALAISLIFVHDIVRNPSAKVLLVLAWCLFGVSLLATLFSFPASQKASEAVYKQIQQGVEELDHNTPAHQAVSALNICAAVTLTGGVVCLIVFAAVNFL
jgi:hypothetical protein